MEQKKSILNDNITRRGFLRVATAGILTLPAINTMAQPNTKLSPEKAAVVAQLKKDLKGSRLSLTGNLIGPKIADIDDIDPLLVGKHVVFAKEWMDFVGPNKPLTHQQFHMFRNKADMVFESYEDLIGKKPVHGDKIFINLREFIDQNTGLVGKLSGLASPQHNVFCINSGGPTFKRDLQAIASHGSAYYTIMHEMAHVFSSGNKWNTDYESTVNLITTYALETNREIQYGSPSERGVYLQKTVGNQQRLRNYQRTVDEFKKTGNMKAFGGTGDAYELYLLGLVDKVGWDVYKQTFRSYDDKNFVPNVYAKESRYVRARDFLDRIEHFSGKPDILRSLPDKGSLLDRHFTFEVVQQNLKPASTAQKDTDSTLGKPTIDSQP